MLPFLTLAIPKVGSVAPHIDANAVGTIGDTIVSYSNVQGFSALVIGETEYEIVSGSTHRIKRGALHGVVGEGSRDVLAIDEVTRLRVGLAVKGVSPCDIDCCSTYIDNNGKKYEYEKRLQMGTPEFSTWGPGFEGKKIGVGQNLGSKAVGLLTCDSDQSCPEFDVNQTEIDIVSFICTSYPTDEITNIPVYDGVIRGWNEDASAPLQRGAYRHTLTECACPEEFNCKSETEEIKFTCAASSSSKLQGWVIAVIIIAAITVSLIIRFLVKKECFNGAELNENFL